MQELFEESLSKSPVVDAIPVLASAPEIAEETSSSPGSSSSDEEAAGAELKSSPFDANLNTWDNSEGYTLKVLRNARDPFKWIRNSHLMMHLRTPEYEAAPLGNLRAELSNTLGSATPSPRGTASHDNSDRHLQLFETDEDRQQTSQRTRQEIRQQNFQYNQDIERAHAESLPAGGASAIPCEDEEDVLPNFILRQDQRTIQQRAKSHRPCKKDARFSYDETKRRKTNKDRQTESRQQEQQKQREVRDTGDSETETTTPEAPEVVRARIKKKTKFNMFGKTFRDVLTWVGKCNELVDQLEKVSKSKIKPTMGDFPTHRSCFTKYGLSFISDDVSRMTQEKSYSLRYFSDEIAKFTPNENPDSQDNFLTGIGFFLLSELHGSLDTFVREIHRRLTFFIRLVIQIGNRDLGSEVAPMLTESPCAGGLSPEDVRISSVNIYK